MRMRHTAQSMGDCFEFIDIPDQVINSNLNNEPSHISVYGKQKYLYINIVRISIAI
jgi:hypothetical protein